MDRVDLFRIFLRVVECASFTRAAASLDLPRSSVSAAIRELERRVGTRLLARSTRRVSPTHDGEAFYTRCQQLVADVEETEALFRRGKAALSGTIKVNLPGRIGRLVVAPALPGFLDRYPGISIELGATDRAINLVEAGVDCAVRVGRLADSELVARPIGLLPLINVASVAYLRRHGRPRKPSDLARHIAVRYASPTTGRVEDWEWQAGGTAHKMRLRGGVTVNNAEACIACCEAGLGLIQVPAYDVAALLRARKLVEVLRDFRAEPLPMTLLYPSRPYLSRRFQAFADWLVILLKTRCCG